MTCLVPFLKIGLPSAVHRPPRASHGAAQSMAPLATTGAASGPLSTPLKRGRSPTPGFGDSLKPSDDLFRLGRVLSVQGTLFENALYRLGHV